MNNDNDNGESFFDTNLSLNLSGDPDTSIWANNLLMDEWPNMNPSFSSTLFPSPGGDLSSDIDNFQPTSKDLSKNQKRKREDEDFSTNKHPKPNLPVSDYIESPELEDHHAVDDHSPPGSTICPEVLENYGFSLPDSGSFDYGEDLLNVSVGPQDDKGIHYDSEDEDVNSDSSDDEGEELEQSTCDHYNVFEDEDQDEIPSSTKNDFSSESRKFGALPAFLGYNYQAQIPDLLTPEQRKFDRENRVAGTLVWDPYVVEMSEVDIFLDKVKKIFGTNFVSEEKSLRMLHQSNYDANMAIAQIFVYEYTLKTKQGWSEHDKESFETGYEINNKDFPAIRNNYLPHKSLSSVMRYYLNWKRSERYEEWCERYFDKLKDMRQPVVKSKNEVVSGVDVNTNNYNNDGSCKNKLEDFDGGGDTSDAFSFPQTSRKIPATVFFASCTSKQNKK
eukprot:TRINITY_DN4367_c0_g1_i4.p1 TRINITY_DN4367_c0_g1~~TRINITY_DN4367_c0_g1_i4.p1  ORF type:complete len:446 (-),score=100.51 TRINITY_DN4367_c0_g1_i4:53-1390(-)